jgi:Cellulase (glycosyl hydrolase family 5)
MTRTSCVTAPKIVEPGAVAFTIVNRTSRLRLFTITGRRSRYVRPRRTGALVASLPRTGLYRYFCLSAGRTRNPRTGVLAVRTVTPPPAPAPEHRIGARLAGDVLELYDKVTGQRFVQRGSNYVRVAPQVDHNGRTITYHSTFNVGLYDAARAEEALRRMSADGFNTVRVFLNGLCRDACIGDPVRGVSASYIANVTDFLRRAKAAGIFVIVTIDWVPPRTRYEQLMNAEPRTHVDSFNVNFLTNGGVRANADFWRDVAAELVRQGAPTDFLLAYELRNEAHFDGEAKPFTLSSGQLGTPNGRTYDLSSQAQKNQLLDENLVYWIDRLRTAIRGADPSALVAIGFFEPSGPNASRPGDSRLIRTQAAIRYSTADFVDIHTYPGLRLTLLQYMQNFGIDRVEAKPVVIGEMGAYRSAYPTPAQAASALQSWQHASCSYGVDGWLVWTWDTEDQPELWNALSGGGVIESALSPRSRPDPCSASTP